MSWFDRFKAILRREAADVKEGVDHLKARLDEELARKERELNATPDERVDMLLEEAESDEARFAELEEKVKKQLHED